MEVPHEDVLKQAGEKLIIAPIQWFFPLNKVVKQFFPSATSISEAWRLEENLDAAPPQREEGGILHWLLIEEGELRLDVFKVGEFIAWVKF